MSAARVRTSSEKLERDGIRATAIHGNKSQGQRERALDDFKTGRAEILVATEVAARGLDIEQLPHVINFELSLVPEDYIHRIGRTARAGLEGEAISLVCVDEVGLLRDIERLVGEIPVEYVDGFEPDRSIRAEPIIRGGARGGSRSQGRPMAAPRSGGTSSGGARSRPRSGAGRRPAAAPSYASAHAPAHPAHPMHTPARAPQPPARAPQRSPSHPSANPNAHPSAHQSAGPRSDRHEAMPGERFSPKRGAPGR